MVLFLVCPGLVFYSESPLSQEGAVVEEVWGEREKGEEERTVSADNGVKGTAGGWRRGKVGVGLEQPREPLVQRQPLPCSS